ncbi:MAG TPA: NAD(P)H-hydrate dehydratase [Cytophagales bacterium]|nr:NAD(P)H-hydrate dehydratase [Cytophagales bacterium]
MKIFNADQIKLLDQATVTLESISSTDLMERAARAFVSHFSEHYPSSSPIVVFCGTGNNGGDGLAIARLLLDLGYTVSCYLAGNENLLSHDARHNYLRLKKHIPVTIITSTDHLPSICPNSGIIIDAIFGTGLNRPVAGWNKQLIEFINTLECEVVSVDIPSGLYTDQYQKEGVAVKADLTITFQAPKLTMLLPENAIYIPRFHIVDIQLHSQSIEDMYSRYHFVNPVYIKKIYRRRAHFSHKGTYGNAILLTGSYGMMGAALLSTMACVRAGAGKTTAYVPSCGYKIMQSGVPEAMTMCGADEKILCMSNLDLNIYDGIGIGPGIGNSETTKSALTTWLKQCKKPTVLDADALNIIASTADLLHFIPTHSVITPHPKEFDRMFGNHNDHLSRLQTGISKAVQLKIIIVLKGSYTAIITPEGQVFFNSTGNAGLAKGGSGDVLTGIITALISQGYESQEAALLGVYLHGLTADLCIKHNIQTMETLTPTDLCAHLHLSYAQVGSY